MKKLTAFRKGVSVLLILITTFAIPANAFAFDGRKPWTTVASAGTVDEADIGQVAFISGYATLSGSAPASTQVTIRYNVVAVDGLFDTGDGYKLKVRFRDNGPDSRVIVRLKAYDLDSGTYSTLMTLDSDDFPESGAFQTQDVTDCSPNWAFNFLAKAYFIEAELRRTATAGTPGLGIIQIVGHVC
jgi:hypothetical protein